MEKRTNKGFSAIIIVGLLAVSLSSVLRATDKKTVLVSEFKISQNSGVPKGWRSQYNKKCSYKTIDDISFKSGRKVLAINNHSETLPSTIRTKNFSLPKKGKLKASVWARGKGLITIFLIHSSWQLATQYKIFPIGADWGKYNVEFEIPEIPEEEQSKTFFLRIDCSGKGDVFLADPSLTLVKDVKTSVTPKERSIKTFCSNLLVNPDFEIGWTGWHPRYFNPSSLESAISQLKRPLPSIAAQGGPDGSRALHMPAGNYVESINIPIQPGGTYTVSAYMKSEKPTKAMLLLIDYKWRAQSQTFNIDSKWRRYSYTFKWDKPCYKNEAYVRIDAPKDCSMLIDKIQCEKGEKSVYKTSPITLGIISKANMIHKGDTPEILIRVLQTAETPVDCSIEASVTNQNGVELLKQTFKMTKNRIFERKLAVPTSEYGFYSIELHAISPSAQQLGSGYGRYAVLRELPKNFTKYYSMGVNFYPHYKPLAYYKLEEPQWKMAGTGLALSGYTTKYSNSLTSPEFIKQFKSTYNYFKNDGFTTLMRVGMPPNVRSEALFNKFPAGDKEWRSYVTKIVQTYSDVSSVFTFLGEINIYRMRKTWRAYCKTGTPPPLGTNLMPPDKGFKYYKSAYLAAKEAHPEVKVCGPSINGEDFAYVKAFMKQGAAKFMDIFGMDAYRAGPDTPEAYHDYMKLKKILSRNGFDGPIINLEQYLGICVKGYLGSAESSRNYYTPWQLERSFAGTIARNYIQHAAAGIVWVNFAPEMSIYDPFLLDGGFTSMAAPAIAAATSFLNTAGTGIKITVTDDLKAFLFPKAANGPLLVVYTPIETIKGSIRMKKISAAYDFMGNKFSKARIASGLPIDNTPIYIQFSSGTTPENIKNAFSDADIMGMGPAFELKILLTGAENIAVDVTNRTNKTLSGTTTIVNAPTGWQLKNKSRKFENLESGKRIRLLFPMKRVHLDNLGTYAISANITSGELFAGTTQKITPMFADHVPTLKIDDDFQDWKKPTWVELNALKKLVYPKDGDYDKKLSAKFATAWNEKGFALKVLVSDETFDTPSETAGAMYEADSIQIYFDQLKNAKDGFGVYNNDDVVYQIGLLNGTPTAYLEQGPEGRYMGSANTLQGIDKDVDVKIEHKNGLTTYSMFFPWKTLKYVKPRAGEVMGFSIFVHDKDGKRNCGISLDTRSPYKKPYVWKDLLLR